MNIRNEDGNLQCPFGFEFVSYTLAAASTSSNIKDACLRIPWWLALLELEALGHRFGEDDETELPCRFSGLVRLIRRTRQERPEATVRNKLETSDAIAAALMASARFHHKLNGHDLVMYDFRSKTQRFSSSLLMIATRTTWLQRVLWCQKHWQRQWLISLGSLSMHSSCKNG